MGELHEDEIHEPETKIRLKKRRDAQKPEATQKKEEAMRNRQEAMRKREEASKRKPNKHSMGRPSVGIEID